MNLGRWASPAKLNLCLHITGRCDNGYHALQSAFVPITLCDTITIHRRGDQRIERAGGLPDTAPEDDLAIRAARQLANASGGPAFGVTIEIDKQIPAGAGLGGGSSNAATVLVALNAVWRTGLGAAALRDLGLQLGADVPFFIDAEPAWVEGVGEQIAPIRVQNAEFLVIVPPVHVSTAAIFSDPKLTRNQPLTKMSALSRSGNVAEMVANALNNCEAVVLSQVPEVAEVFDWLKEFGRPRMSGTGSAVFVVVDNAAVAATALERMPARWRGWHCGIRSGSRRLDDDRANLSVREVRDSGA